MHFLTPGPCTLYPMFFTVSECSQNINPANSMSVTLETRNRQIIFQALILRIMGASPAVSGSTYRYQSEPALPLPFQELTELRIERKRWVLLDQVEGLLPGRFEQVRVADDVRRAQVRQA